MEIFVAAPIRVFIFELNSGTCARGRFEHLHGLGSIIIDHLSNMVAISVLDPKKICELIKVTIWSRCPLACALCWHKFVRLWVALTRTASL